MAAVDLNIMTPIQLNSTVLATENVSFNPGEGARMFRHSGLPYASSLVQTSQSPSLSFRAPFEGVYGVLGFNITELTTVEWGQRTFTNFGANDGGVKYELA